MWGWWLACADPPRPTCDVDGPHLLVASTDYASGVLGAAALDGSCLAEPLASAGVDPLVRRVGDLVAYADRSDGDAVRLYAPGRYGAPTHEFALPAGGNTHDVARVGDELWFARYDEPHLTVTDLRGRELDRVDLSAYADADGLPEADALVVDGDRLFVGLQRLDFTRGGDRPPPAGPGLVLEVDPAGRRVVDAVEVGPNPKLRPGLGGGWVAATGVFFAPDGEVTRGGDGAPEVLATERELGFDVTLALDTADGLVLFGLDTVDTEPSHLVCGDVHLRTPSWPVDAVVDDAGRAWGVDRPMDWAGTGESAAWTLGEGCAVEQVGTGFLLGPFSTALVPSGP